MSTKPEPMTDQEVVKYAISRQPMLPLTAGQRVYLAAQIKAPLKYSPSSTDKALASAVLASWSRQAVVAQRPKIDDDLAVQQWFDGEPEVYQPSPTRAFFASAMIATIATTAVVVAYIWLFT